MDPIHLSYYNLDFINRYTADLFEYFTFPLFSDKVNKPIVKKKKKPVILTFPLYCFRMNRDERKVTEETPPRRKFSDIVDALKSLANTRVAKIKHQEEDSESFNNVIGNVDLNNIKWINMDKNDLKLNLDQDGQKPFQIVYDASRKPIGYIAEAPTPPTPAPKPNTENYYIDSILNSLNSKNIIRQSEKNHLHMLNRPNSENPSKNKRIVIRRVPVPFRAAEMNHNNQLTNSLGTPEMQETIIDPVKRTVTTISKYPPFNENEIRNAQLRAPYSEYFSQYFSQYFPLVIHDPFQTYYNSYTDLIEYGEEADICSKTKENVRQGKAGKSGLDETLTDGSEEDIIGSDNEYKEDRSRQEQNTRMRRSTYEYDYLPSKNDKSVSAKSKRINNKPDAKFQIKKPFGSHSNRNKLTSALNKIKENKGDSAQSSESLEGYSGTSISSLKVRRGGVAIAGPGGIATAGSGGTAILGPGQSAYTTSDGEHNRRSGGVAVVGPSHRLLSVPDNQDSRLLNLPPGAKLLTTGPIVYMNPVNTVFS